MMLTEDGNKDKKNGRRKDYEGNDDGAIKSDQLVEIMEETIRLFWRFVRCDKLTSSIHDQKSRTKSQIEPDHEEDSEDLEMFAEVKSQLQNVSVFFLKKTKFKNFLNVLWLCD